jgi:hypothetical protein
VLRSPVCAGKGTEKVVYKVVYKARIKKRKETFLNTPLDQCQKMIPFAQEALWLSTFFPHPCLILFVNFCTAL